MSRFNSALHPRGPNGQFIPKLSHSVRVSTRSVSYNAGVRVPVVPGRASLYVGGLARLERNGGGNFGKKTTNRVVNSIARRFGDPEGQSNIARIAKGEEANVGNFRVKRSSSLTRNPTLRLAHGRAPEPTHHTEPAPRRRQRTPARSSSRTVPSTITGVRSASPRAITKKGSRPQRRNAAAGKKIRRR